MTTDNASTHLDLDTIRERLDASEGRTYAPPVSREDVRVLLSEVERLRDGIRQLRTVAEAFGVERTHWTHGNVTAETGGLAIPNDCDTCEVVIDSDVYEAMTDLFDLLDDRTETT